MTTEIHLWVFDPKALIVTRECTLRYLNSMNFMTMGRISLTSNSHECVVN